MGTYGKCYGERIVSEMVLGTHGNCFGERIVSELVVGTHGNCYGERIGKCVEEWGLSFLVNELVSGRVT